MDFIAPKDPGVKFGAPRERRWQVSPLTAHRLLSLALTTATLLGFANHVILPACIAEPS